MAFLLLFSGVSGAAAQNAGPNVRAAPVAVVEGEILAAPAIGPAVVELFSSQACVFCPRADQLLADLAAQEGIIALACHVDYFDVSVGSLAQPFCAQRQTAYNEKLYTGPNYTPQMIMNGGHDVVGYKYQDVLNTLKTARGDGVVPIAIVPVETIESFRVSFALPPRAEDDAARLWVAHFDKPQKLTVAEGRNKGERVTYVNVISALTDMGAITGGMTGRVLRPDLMDRHAGFALLVQDENTGRILAAGQFRVAD